MDDDDFGLGDLGVETPARVLPRAAKAHAKDWSTPTPLGGSRHAGPVVATPAEGGHPAWVGKVRDWKGPEDLGALPPMVEMAVGELIQAGKVGVLASAGGVGKTTLKITLGICHAIGRPFLGMLAKRGTFVLLSADDSQEDLDAALSAVVRAMKLTAAEIEAVRARMRVISLQGEPGTQTFATISGGNAVPTGMVEFVLAALEDIDDLVGIAFDTLRQFSGGATNDEQIMKTAIAGATEIARVTGAYVLLPHHVGKQNYRDGVNDMYCGSGSAAIADNARFVLLLQATTWADIEAKVRRTGQERGYPLVLTSTRGSLLVKPPAPIFLHRDGFSFGRIAGSELTPQQIADERDRAILQAVRRGARSKNAVCAAVKGKRQAVLERIAELECRGLLVGGSQSGSHSLTVSIDGIAQLEVSE